MTSLKDVFESPGSPKIEDYTIYSEKKIKGRLSAELSAHGFKKIKTELDTFYYHPDHWEPVHGTEDPAGLRGIIPDGGGDDVSEYAATRIGEHDWLDSRSEDGYEREFFPASTDQITHVYYGDPKDPSADVEDL